MRVGFCSPTNLGMWVSLVAEVRILCLTLGSASIISVISFSKPISNDLSNSSNIRVLIYSRENLSRLIRSATRPGVPIRMAGRWRKSILSSEPERPPYTAFTLKPEPMFRATCSICCASSREGTSISS